MHSWASDPCPCTRATPSFWIVFPGFPGPFVGKRPLPMHEGDPLIPALDISLQMGGQHLSHMIVALRQGLLSPRALELVMTCIAVAAASVGHRRRRILVRRSLRQHLTHMVRPEARLHGGFGHESRRLAVQVSSRPLGCFSPWLQPGPFAAAPGSERTVQLRLTAGFRICLGINCMVVELHGCT